MLNRINQFCLNLRKKYHHKSTPIVTKNNWAISLSSNSITFKQSKRVRTDYHNTWKINTWISIFEWNLKNLNSWTIG